MKSLFKNSLTWGFFFLVQEFPDVENLSNRGSINIVIGMVEMSPWCRGFHTELAPLLNDLTYGTTKRNHLMLIYTRLVLLKKINLQQLVLRSSKLLSVVRQG